MQIDNLQAKANNIESILSSLDDIKRAEAPPFLYGKIKARLNSPGPGFLEKLINLISRPVRAISFLLVVLFIDGIIFQSNLKSTPAKPENASENTFNSDSFEEMLFYDPSESIYASI